MEKNCVWLAEEVTAISLKNPHEDAFSYQLMGFFRYKDEDQASTWVEQGGTITREECPDVPETGYPRRKITMVSIIDPSAAQPLVGCRGGYRKHQRRGE